MKKLLSVLMMVLYLTSFSQVVPNKDWVVQITNGGIDIHGIAAAVDYTSGAVYSCGYMNTVSNGQDIVVVKLDSNGVQLWSATYNYTVANLDDKANAICVDPSGNVYVTGYSQAASNNADIIVIKYNSSGTQQWATRLTGNANSDDCGNSIGVDGSGNVYVAGYATITGKGKDFSVSKLNSSGVHQGTLKLNGSANSDDAAEKLTIDGSNLFATGSIKNTSTNKDVLTICVATSGPSVTWSTTVNGSTSSDDTGLDVKTYGSDVYICGKTNNTTTGEDYYFAKMAQSNGAIGYSNTYDGGYNGSDFATSLVSDNIGDFGITGIVTNGSNIEYHTQVYSTSALQWTHIQPQNGNYTTIYPKIAVDTIAYHYYVCGAYFNGTQDAILYQVDPSGVKRWTQYHDGAGAARDVHADLAVNGLGQIYVASANETGTATGSFDYGIIRYSQTPVYFPPDTVDVTDKSYVLQKNDGQLHYTNGSRVPESVVGYYYQGKSPSVYINNNRVSYLLLHQLTDSLPADSTVRVDMNFVSSNTLTSIYAYDTVPHYFNYFIDSISPVTKVRGYNRVFIPNVWTLTDIHHSSNTSGLKSFFCFKITEAVYTHVINIDGADTTYINGSGELIAETPLGIVNIGGVRGIQIDSTYTPFPVTTVWTSLGSNNYRFSITGLHPMLPLIVVLGKTGAASGSAASNINNLYWSTYIGDVGNENIAQSEIDAKDQFYTVGYTYSNAYPTTPGANLSSGNNLSNRQFAVFSKFNPQGNLHYSSYYGSAGFYNVCGGQVYTEAFDITVDSLYSIYIVGKTNSSSLIIKTPSGAMNYSNSAATGSGGTCQNAYIAKFDSTGTNLEWSSYYGGTTNEFFKAVKYSKGQIYAAGWSLSSAIPLTSPPPNAYQINKGNGFYLHLDTSGALIHSTKLTGYAQGIDVDKNGNAYVIGYALTNTMTTVAADTTYFLSGYVGAADWFINRFTPADSLNWSTYIGGTSSDQANAICIKDTLMGIVGFGTSSNFPWHKSASDSGNAYSHFASDIQMAKFNLKNGKRIWVANHSTFMNEQANDLAFDSDYNLYVTGMVDCPTGTTTPCSGNQFRTLSASTYYNQSTHIGPDAFILAFDKANKKKWLTYFGASTSTYYNTEVGDAMSVNSKNQLFMSGQSYLGSSSLPLAKWNSTCWYDSTSADSYPNQNADGFITMFDVTNFTAIGIVEHTLPVKSNSFILFPNPNSGSFKIKLNENIKEPVNIDVYNVLGQNIYSEKKIKDKQEIPLELNSLNQGIYFVNLSDQNFSETVKFVVE
jgi:hypothetical protein